MIKSPNLLRQRLSERAHTPNECRFPSVAQLLKHHVAEDRLTAELARLIWKKVWAHNQAYNLRKGYGSDILELLPATRAWVLQCHNMPHSRSIRKHALNEVLGMHGIEVLYRQRKERINGEWVDVNTDIVFAEYLNSGDPYVPTLIWRVGGMGPLIGCWGDLPEVKR